MLNNALVFGLASTAAVVVSFILDWERTLCGVKRGLSMFFKMAPPFVNILILVSIALYLIPEEFIATYLGPGSGSSGFLVAAVAGSIALIPGFVSYPMAAALISKGASYSVVAVFMTTLMMVGVLTLPLEAKYFGWKAAVIRNVLNFFAAFITGLFVGWLM